MSSNSNENHKSTLTIQGTALYFNEFLFAEFRRTSEWTPWIRTNVTREGFVEQRFRFVCRANVPDIRMLRVSNVKTDYRFCPDSGDQCVEPGEQNVSSKLDSMLQQLCSKFRSAQKPTKAPEWPKRDKVRNKRPNEVSNKIPVLNDARRYPRTHRQVYTGYCACRDLGVLRMCRKCRMRIPSYP